MELPLTAWLIIMCGVAISAAALFLCWWWKSEMEAEVEIAKSIKYTSWGDAFAEMREFAKTLETNIDQLQEQVDQMGQHRNSE